MFVTQTYRNIQESIDRLINLAEPILRGRGGRSICRWTGNVDFQYGISRFWEKYGWETVFLTLDGAGNY